MSILQIFSQPSDATFTHLLAAIDDVLLQVNLDANLGGHLPIRSLSSLMALNLEPSKKR